MRSSSSLVGLLGLGAALLTSCVLSREGGLEAPPGGEGGSGAAGGFGGAMSCESPSDCGANTDCATVDCVGGECVSVFAAAGTPCSGTAGTQIVCDGMGSCVECAGGQDCVPGMCADGVQTGGEVCVDGLCTAVGDPLSCGEYLCDPAGTTCLSSCTSEADCSPGHYCEPVTSSCETPNDVGELCSVNEGCVTGFCVDGVCCDAACDGTCLGCAGSLTGVADGACSPIAFGTDPDQECTFGYGCDDDASCIECGEATSAPVGGNCPAVCNGNCTGDVCNIDCTSGSTCDGQTITCPAGWDCDIDCLDVDSCKGSTIDCPAGRVCDVTCSDQDHSCQNAVVNCDADGPCKVACPNSGNHCDGTDVNCGGNRCEVDCVSGGKPTLIGEAGACDVVKDADCS